MRIIAQISTTRHFSVLIALSVFFPFNPKQTLAQSTLPDIVATACNACTFAEYEAKAISLRVGRHYIYDFSNRRLRHYEILREAGNGGRPGWVASLLPIDPAYEQYFINSVAHRDLYGSFTKAVIVNLPDSSGHGHASDSVYDLFRDSSIATTFGQWLGQYMRQTDAAAASAERLIVDKPGITYTEDEKRVDVRVEFGDGYADFELDIFKQNYTLKRGSAIDSDGNTIPHSLNDVSALPYRFGGGSESSNARNMRGLIERFDTTRLGSWTCGTASGGGISSVTCVWARRF